MPGLDGFALLRALRADPRTRDVPVILLSARAGDGATVEGLQAGADDYLTKPFSAQELLARVTTHLQLHASHDAALAEERAASSRHEQLAAAALSVQTAPTPEAVARVLAAEARALSGADHITVRLTRDPALPPITASAGAAPEDAGAPRRVPLATRDGRALGSLRVIGPRDATADAALAQLAGVAAVALANLQRLADARQAVQTHETFLAIAAHELRNPLTSLRGYAQLLKRTLARDLPPGERERRAAAVIDRQAVRLGHLVTMLLDLSRIQAGQLVLAPEPLDLRTLVGDLTAEQTLTAGDHRLVVDLPPEPVPVDGDPLRLEEVVLNLLQNAIKYSPDGAPVHVRLCVEGGMAQLEIADEGSGIPPEERARLFQPFSRGEDATRRGIAGLGIGLYVVREVVTLHGGTVAVESTPGEGSTFLVRLPLRAPAPASA